MSKLKSITKTRYYCPRCGGQISAEEIECSCGDSYTTKWNKPFESKFVRRPNKLYRDEFMPVRSEYDTFSC
jgi:ribosomal protein S27AE